MTVEKIHEAIRLLGGFSSVYVPEFTYGDRRIDALIIDVRTRWIRGFEIKVSRSDFIRDEKWHTYSEFCSSLAVACPEGLIQPEEIESPFGLLWVGEVDDVHTSKRWMKRPKNFQRRNAMAWLYTYVRVIEKEMPRMEYELSNLRNEIRYLKRVQP